MSIIASDRMRASHRAITLVSSSLAIAATLVLGGCAGSGLDLGELGQSSTAVAIAPAGAIETGSLPAVPETPGKAAAVKEPPVVAKARALREAGDKTAAMTLLDEASAKSPADKVLLKERGLLALDLGRIAEARKLLKEADDDKAPDWRVKSALGSAHAASGDHKSAQKEFAAALKLAPDHPSILNNMALSQALEGRHEDAEKLLRRVATSRHGGDRAKQNLALILGLSGNIDEARQVSEAALPQPVAAANVSYLERLRSSTRVSRARRDGDEQTAATATLGALDSANR